MSTISVYKRGPIINVSSPELPNNPYGLYKLKTDKFLLNSSSKKISITCIRPPLVYGNSAPGNIFKLINLSKMSIPLPFKNVNNKLSFINIDNLTEFIHVVIKKKIINVVLPTDKNETSTREIIKTVRVLQNKSINLFSMPFFFHKTIKFFFPNLYSKLFESLVIESNVRDSIFKPKYFIYDGIKKTLSKNNND